MAHQRSLPGFEDRSLPDRYCDLVLTGGVTSAIAYPGVIHGLAQAYRFNSIGGSSSGAGSAALAAAAEYRRRHGSSEGFRTLLRRTSEIKDERDSRTGLDWLFQPYPRSKRLFDALLPAFAGPDRRRSRFLNGVAAAYRWHLLVALLMTAAIVLAVGAWLRDGANGGGAYWGGWGFAALLAGVLVSLIWTVSRIWSDVRVAADNDYGLCSGLRDDQLPAKPQALTDWLHDLLQDIAGLPPERPLTFADLHSAPGGPCETLGDASPGGARSIDLRMFAADVTQGRPLLLPQSGDEDEDEDESKLFFRPREFRRLFPREVVDAMKRHSKVRGKPADAIEPKRVDSKGGLADDPDNEEAIWDLPRLKLPVIVAARMSVSFPVLFSAVPLWQRDPINLKRFRRLLIADGGLCSNFPIHLFDSPIPAWPTFGVSLYAAGSQPSLDPQCIANRVRVPLDHLERRSDRASTFDQQKKPLQRVLGFAGALLTTIKDWNDSMLAELPGVRERIADVALPENIGGLNILMKPEQIECLALLGGEAARQLLARYTLPEGSGGQAPGWLEHRWVRFNVLSECLQTSMVGLSRSAQHARHAEPLREQIRRAIEKPPLVGPEEVPLQQAHAAALERTLDALLQIERALTPRTLEQPYRPMPQPELRIRPRM